MGRLVRSVTEPARARRRGRRSAGLGDRGGASHDKSQSRRKPAAGGAVPKLPRGNEGGVRRRVAPVRRHVLDRKVGLRAGDAAARPDARRSVRVGVARPSAEGVHPRVQRPERRLRRPRPVLRGHHHGGLPFARRGLARGPARHEHPGQGPVPLRVGRAALLHPEGEDGITSASVQKRPEGEDGVHAPRGSCFDEHPGGARR
mmetsp:Transcript_28150/g.63024  ORF Transcript_28150/g.63024 Transcript_28150/m.63024 type:complete len:202 (-) Transcript_28150:60-665(-)